MPRPPKPSSASPLTQPEPLQALKATPLDSKADAGMNWRLLCPLLVGVPTSMAMAGIFYRSWEAAALIGIASSTGWIISAFVWLLITLRKDKSDRRLEQ